MGTHFHVRIAASILVPTLASGCIFGGGGDKSVPQAVAVAPAPLRVPVSDDPLAAAQRSADAAHAADVRTLRQARSEALAKAMSPQQSEVKWPGGEELRLTDRPAANDEHAQQLAPVADERINRTRPLERPEHAPLTSPEIAVVHEAAAPTVQAPARGAVANRGLDLAEIAQPAAPAAAIIAEPSAAPVVKDTLNADALSRKVAQNLRDNPSDVAAHLEHQLLRYLMDENVPDLNTISTLPTEDRELLTALLDGLTNFRNGLRGDNNMLLSRKVRPLLDLAARLRSQAELSIPTIALCRKMDGFGLYEPIDARFLAGVKNAAIVYCEVANVSSQQNDKGVWESKLSQEAVLYTESGQRVWSSPRQTVPDRSRNRRQDFCVAQVITLPPNLSVNRYILKVTVMDEQVKRVAEATMPIDMVAQIEPAIAGPVASPRPTTANAAADERLGAARPASERQPAEQRRSSGNGDVTAGR